VECMLSQLRFKIKIRIKEGSAIKGFKSILFLQRRKNDEDACWRNKSLSLG